MVPTCSYRMGTIDMGIGVAILGEYKLFYTNYSETQNLIGKYRDQCMVNTQ